MKTQNKAQLIGYLGADPKISKTVSGIPYATMRLATNQTISKKDEKPKEITTWHRVAVFGNAWMPFVENHLLKGSHILVEGPVLNRSYEDKKGIRPYVSEIKASHIMNLDR